MWSFFPGNYRWSQAVLRLLYTGGTIGEAARAIAALQPAAAEADEEAWFEAWRALGDHLWEQGQLELADGHTKSARESLLRACLYDQWAIAFIPHTDPRRAELHQRSIDAFSRFAEYAQPPIERVEVPYEATSLPAWFLPASTAEEQRPTVCFLPGLESTKEQGLVFAQAIAGRGFNVLLVDGPGVGESVLFRGIVNRHDEEVAGTAYYAYLAERPDVDAQHVALVGLSLGGYRVARVAAFEHRYAACVAWGAVWDFGAVWAAWDRQIRADRGATSTTHEHMLHVFGAKTAEELSTKLEAWRLDGVASQIRCPLLILHGEQDAQIPLDDAYRLYRGAGSSLKELKIFTAAEGGAAHCQNDNRLLAHAYMADWLEDVLIHNRPRRGLMVGWEHQE